MNVLARYMNVKMDLVQSQETVQLKSLKADLEKSAVRIMLADLLLTCQRAAESGHCLFTLICQGCAQEYWQKRLPHCTSRLRIHSLCHAHHGLARYGPLLMSQPNYAPLLVALREKIDEMFCFKGQYCPLELALTWVEAFCHACLTHTHTWSCLTPPLPTCTPSVGGRGRGGGDKGAGWGLRERRGW